MKNYPRNIIVHHTAVSYYENSEQFEAVDDYHKGLGWGKIGYHYFIEKNGVIKTGRGEREVGAHTKQKLMNYRSIGICLSGNFDVEDPTSHQKNALLTLIRELQRKYRVPDKKVFAHRHFAGYKSCWGNRLPNNILKYLEEPEFIPDWPDAYDGHSAESIWNEAKETGKVSRDSQFDDPVSKGELMIIAKRFGIF